MRTGLMILVGLFSLIVIAVVIGDGSADAVEIEAQMERWLRVDVPSDFEVLNSEYSFAIGDDLWTVEIEFTPSAFERLVHQVDLSEWNESEWGYQLDAVELHDHGNDFFLMTIKKRGSTNARIQWGQE